MAGPHVSEGMNQRRFPGYLGLKVRGACSMARCGRSASYQAAHFRVYDSTCAVDFQGPRKLLNSVLNRPMTFSARSLSYGLPSLPSEGPALPG